MISFFKRYPYACLLLAQLLSILLYGFLGESKLSHLFLNCLGLLVPILAVWVVYRTPAVNWVAFALAAPAICLSMLAEFGEFSQLLPWAHSCESLLYFYAAISLVLSMYKDDQVTLDELYAAAATFTLLVWGFALAYSVCQQAYPQSIAAATNPTAPRTWIELLFMSFSIQSSTGVGDVIPISSQARAISSIQIFSGVMYLAIIVSRLVSLAQTTKKN